MEKMNLFGEQTCNDIVGIDLGTTNSAVAIYNAGTVPTLLPVGKDGKYTVPSCVRWDGFNGDTGEHQFTVGDEAYQERYKSDVIYSVKRMMGSGSSIVLTRRTEPPYPSPTDYDWDESLDLELTPAQVSAEILRHLKNKVAEFYRPCTKCVITVPAYFNQRQIEDTMEASKLAGLECLQILKEPTSASYIYSLLGYATNGSVLIYDLGGGTFDVTHMRFLRRDAVPNKLLTSLKRQYGIVLDNAEGADSTAQYFCRVLGTYGDIHLGGDDIDKALGDHLIKRDSLSLSVRDRELLYLKCEEFKKAGIYGLDAVIADHKVHMTSDDLDVAVDSIFEKTLRIMEDIDMSDVKTIVLVGGSTKSQRIRDNLSRAFPNIEISAVLDPDATVALGAGSVAKAIASNSDLMYSDVLPLPIGVLVEDKRVDVCIAKNTSMPHTVTKEYHTLYDNQTRITVHVYQGVSSNPKQCTYLGRLVLEDIPKKPAGDVDVKVSFVLTGQGRLKIISRIDGINKEESLVIDNIFDVKGTSTEGDTEQSSTNGGTLVPLDDFERNFLLLAEGKPDALELFLARRNLLKDSGLSAEARDQEVAKIEDFIVEKVLQM